MAEKVIKIRPEDLRPVKSPSQLTELQVENLVDVRMARARAILGRDFLGRDAILAVKESLRGVDFDIDRLPLLTYSELDLQLARQNGEMLVLRPGIMFRGDRGVPITLRELKELFGDSIYTRRKELFNEGTYTGRNWPPIVVSSVDFHLGEALGEEMKLQWALVKKDVLDGSLNRTWNDQETLLEQYRHDLKGRGADSVDVRRRTAVEVVWDSMLYGVNTGGRLLEDVYDWGQSRLPDGNIACVGLYDSKSWLVYDEKPGSSGDSLGVCPSR